MDYSQLDQYAAGLNLSLEEDRALFRAAVARWAYLIKVTVLREWSGCTATDRTTVVRFIADRYIEQLVTRTHKKPAATRVNALLKKAGHTFILRRGEGYYYLSDTGEQSVASGFPDAGLYVYRLDNSEGDFLFTRAYVNDVLKNNGLAPLVNATTKEK